MKKEKLLTIFLFIFLFININFSSSLECWGEFEMNTEIQLIQKCPSCSYTNLTSISYPNGTVFYNVEMEKNGVNFNYTLPDSSQQGIISYGVIGDKNGISPPKEETLCILLTPTGNSIDTGESLIYIWILIILAVLSALGIYLSTIIPYKNIEEEVREGKIVKAVTKTKYMKLIVIWITSGIILSFLTILTGLINNYIQFVEMKGLFTNTYMFLRILSYGLSTTIIWLLFLNLWKDILLNKQIVEHGKAFIEDNGRRF
jgi:hypothetical protein